MNPMDILNLIGRTPDRYLLEAERAVAVRPRRNFKKLALIAAAAAALLLTGCAAVILGLQARKIAQEPYTQEVDLYGHAQEPEEKTRDVLTFCGPSDSPAGRAAAQWYAFTRDYDPGELGNLADDPAIPNNLEYTYQCATPEMAQKLQEIAGENGLKLLGESQLIQRYAWDTALEGMGIGSLFRAGAPVEAENAQGLIYPPTAFKLELSLRRTGEDALWNTPVFATVFYTGKDYMAPPGYYAIDSSLYEQWDYVTADGVKLLLALGAQGDALIFADRDDASVGIQLTISNNHLQSENGQAPTRAAVEQLAELFDYTIRPQVKDAEALAAALRALDEEEAAQAEATLQGVPTYEGIDGYLQENRISLLDTQFAWADLDGDGKQDLCLGQGGAIETCIITAEAGFAAHPLQEGRLLADGGVRWELIDLEGGFESYEYFDPYAAGKPLAFSEEDWGGLPGARRFTLCREGDQWMKYGPEDEMRQHPENLSEAEARALMDENPVAELEWKPLGEYPMASGETFGDYLESVDVSLSEEALLKAYREFLAGEGAAHYVRYRLLDVNRDGVTDLLLSSDSLADLDPDSAHLYWAAVSYKYGQLCRLKDASDFYLCEDGVLEHVSDRNVGKTRMELHEFYRLQDREKEVLATLYYDRRADSWYEQPNGAAISASEAETVRGQYPRADQGFLPVSQFP